ncbi:MAG: hypothetical protein V1915_04205 [Candidatus Bathyarchaeota archaeon]
MGKFLKIAQSMGIKIKAPENSFISFYNSPYYSHKNGLAVDIYPNNDDPLPYAPSPVDGTIINIFEFKASNKTIFETPESEKLILISPPKKPELRVRILHVNSKLRIGTQIVVGEPLGHLERSGFFDFWTNRHIHVEIRTPKEPLRAKGAFPMIPLIHGGNISGDVKGSASVRRVKVIGQNYLLAEINGGLIKLGNFWGLGCTIGRQLGILDCGFPHYGYGGIHLATSSFVKPGDPVRLWDTEVGSVLSVYRNFALFKCKPLAVYVDDIPFRGFSLYLWLKPQIEIKLVPYEPLTTSPIPKKGKIELKTA